MAPKNVPTNTARRKAGPFHPPSLVKEATESSKSKKGSTTATSRPVHAAKKSRVPATIISSDQADEEDDNDYLTRGEEGEEEEEEEASVPVGTKTMPVPAAPPIPAPLLARLLYENFENPNTQIQKGAMSLTGKYMEIFVREALARARHEREQAVKDGAVVDGFLQVEDLERLTPQLVLDF